MNIRNLFLFVALALPSLHAGVPEMMFLKALKENNLPAIETLLSAGFDPNKPVNGFTPFYFALDLDRADIVQMLLEWHADPNAPAIVATYPGGSSSPLQIAMQKGNLRLAHILIAAGARVDEKAMREAVEGGRLDAIRLLIEHGADLNARDKEGASLLDNAVWRGSLDTVALLLAHGARLNDVNLGTGATPINEAAFIGNARIVRYLLQFRPELGIPDKHGYLPLENAMRMGREEAALLLLEAESKERTTPQFLGKAMESAARRDESILVATLLQRGALANQILPSGTTPLELAASSGAAKVVGILLNHGADPNRPGKDGATSLENASLRGYDSIATILLDHGAQVNQLNAGSGATALYAAASFGKSAVVKLLLSRGADPLLCGENKKSAYQSAVENGYSDVAALLRNHGGDRACVK